MTISEHEASQSELGRESEQLHARLGQLEAEVSRYRRQEQLLSKTLLAAMSFASKIRDDARHEAVLILRKANSRAVDKATAVQQERDDLEREVVRLRRIADEMKKGLSTLLASTLGQLRLQAETDLRSSESGTEFQGAVEASLHRAIRDGSGSASPGEEVAPSDRPS